MQKASIASASTLGLIRRTEINSVQTLLKSLNALVNSVVIYASEIWSRSQMHALVSLQSKFFKTALNLPNCMMHYAIRFELQVFSVECKVFKLILNLIGKIIRKDTRFPKALLRTLLEMDMYAANNLVSYNWISQI